MLQSIQSRYLVTFVYTPGNSNKQIIHNRINFFNSINLKATKNDSILLDNLLTVHTYRWPKL